MIVEPERVGLSLAKNADGIADLHLDAQGNLVLVKNAEAIAQHVRQRLMTHEGEWFLDIRAGVPWVRDILGRNYDPVLSEAVLKAEILETDGVVDISSFSVRFSQETRALTTYNIEVVTVYDGQEVVVASTPFVEGPTE